MDPKITVCATPGEALVLGFAVHGDRVYAVGGQGYDLFYVSDDGTKFAQGSSPGKGLRSVFARDDGLWVVGEYGYIARSNDQGATWTRLPTKTQECLFGVTDDDQKTLWFGGDHGALWSAADGTKLKKVTTVKEPVGRLVSSPLGVLLPTDTPGHLFFIRGGKIERSKLEAGKEVMQATVTPQGTIVTAGLEGQVHRSDDGGKSWKRIKTDAKVMLTGVDSFEDGRVVVVGEEGVVLLSTDDGKSFARLEQFVTAGTLWCVKRYRTAILIGGEDGLVMRLGELESKRSVIAKPAAANVIVPPPLNPAWVAPPPSTARQAWTPPPPAPLEVRDGIYVTPELRALLFPRRGGIAVAQRPLPTQGEAWSALRRGLWAADRAHMDAKKERSGIWDLVTSQSATERRMGERILSVTPQAGTFEDDTALVSLTLARYQTFIHSHHEQIWDALADFLVASVGLPEAVSRMLTGLDDELPYTEGGPFERLRDHMVLASDAVHAEASRALKTTLEREAARAKEKRDDDRHADLHWAATFLLPEDGALHEAALAFVGEFGNADVRPCGIASGNLATLERYLKKNKDVGHEFFATQRRMFLASVLESDGRRAGPVLARMKPSEPFDDDVHYNTRWCRLLAHIDDDAALDALMKERKSKVGRIWGTGGLLFAARCNPSRVSAYARAKGDKELVDLIARGGGMAEEATPAGDLEVADVGAPFHYEPIPASRPTLVHTKLPIAPEETWRDAERDAARASEIYDDAAKWNDKSLRKQDAAELEAFVLHHEKWAIPTLIEDMALANASAHPRLMALGFKIERYWVSNGLPGVMSRCGLSALPLLLAALEDAEALESALVVAQPIGDVSIARAIAPAFAGKKNKTAARSWILRHPVHAAAGTVALLAQNESPDEASRVLRYLASRGKRDVVLEHAKAHGIEPRVRELLDQDPLSAPGVKPPVLPKYAAASKLPALADTKGRKAKPSDVDRLLLELAWSNADEIHPGVLAAKRTFSESSRAAFAWKLFESWLTAKADPKHGWCMQTVGFLGDDDCARKLAALAKQWPGEGKSVRAQAALDALLNIGSDAALVNINLLAEKSRFPAFKAAAAERIAMIADARGLSTDELQDRLAPSLGLDEEGGNVLDYGKRRFTVEFDERLAPVLRDAEGNVLTDAPKPGKTDNAARAKEAKARFSGLKKDARTTASLQISRLERAMRAGRIITRDVFLTCFAGHPWMRFLAQRLVWAEVRGAERSEPSGKIQRSFRVSSDGTLADSKDKPFELPKDAKVVVAHPLLLSAADRDAWNNLFAEYSILQPFPQLGRPVFEATDAERLARTIDRFHGRQTTYGALRGLESRGWEKWVDDSVGGMALRIDRSAWVLVSVDPGWHPSETADTIGPQTIDAVVMHAPKDTTFGALSPVLFSEIVRDVETLLPA